MKLVLTTLGIIVQVHEEVLRLRQQSRGVTGSAAMIRRLEAERDDAKMELKQV